MKVRIPQFLEALPSRTSLELCYFNPNHHQKYFLPRTSVPYAFQFYLGVLPILLRGRQFYIRFLPNLKNLTLSFHLTTLNIRGGTKLAVVPDFPLFTCVPLPQTTDWYHLNLIPFNHDHNPNSVPFFGRDHPFFISIHHSLRHSV